MGALATSILLLLLLPLIPVYLYLTAITLSAPLGLLRRFRPSSTRRRFAVLIPAHDEATTIGTGLSSLARLDYDKDAYEVVVVADNCTDATAMVARAAGATVYERFDQVLQGKGHALRWLLERLAADGRSFDAYVVLDADSTVSANFLRRMNDALDGGARVAQGYYTVLPRTGRRAEALRAAALALVHFLRPAAKRAWRASCGLKGNGMCFERAVLERFGWPAAGLTEDVEFHLILVSAGIAVQFVPDALIYAEMPDTLKGAQSQNLRWEAGRLSTVRGQALPLLWRGIRRRSVVMIDAAVEQLVPPLSIPVLATGAVGAAGLLLGAPVVWVPATLMLALLALHVAAALLLARAPLAVYLALVHAPVYMLWKLLVYVRALTSRERRWIRTERANP